MVGLSGSAGAAPAPTPAQAQKMLAQLNREATKLGQQYAEVVQRLVLANQRLKFLNKQTGFYRATFDTMRRKVARLAVVAYEQGDVGLAARAAHLGLAAAHTQQGVDPERAGRRRHRPDRPVPERHPAAAER